MGGMSPADGLIPDRLGLMVDERMREEAERILGRALFQMERKAAGVSKAFSVTALDAYRACPLKFKLSNLLRVPQAHELDVGMEEGGRAAGGVRFGAAFHRAMELIEPKADLQGQLDDLISAGIVDPTMVEPLREKIRILFDGPLGGMIISAAGIERERSFTLILGASTITGTMDLLIYGSRGEIWIVDYKTDAVGPEDVGGRAEEHAFQLRAYACALKEITGAPPAGGIIYFATPGLLSEVDVSGRAIEDWRGEALRILERIGKWEFRGRSGEGCERCEYHRGLCAVKND